MPERDPAITAKIRRVEQMPAGERRPSEFVAVHWPEPDGVLVYSIAHYDEMPGWEGVRQHLPGGGPVVATLVPAKSAPFSKLPRSASISDDTAEWEASDVDGEWSRLLATYGEGIRVEVFGYWAGGDLWLSLWRGLLQSPGEASAARVRVKASTGFRSPQLLLPRRPHATSCPFIYGGLLRSQAEIDYHPGCPYNAHLTEEERAGAPVVGVPGLPDCARDSVATCFAHLLTKRFWPAFDIRTDPVANNQTKGPNLMANAVGNVSQLSDPVRVIIGERLVRALPLLAYRNETNTRNHDRGFGAGLFEVGEGPVEALWGFAMNNIFVGAQHYNLRLGELGQPPTGFSPNVNSFSGTAHAFGRIQGNFNNNQAASLTGAIMARGLRDIRVYESADSYERAYTDNRMWGLLECLTNPRWGYGNDYPRYWIDSAAEVAAWCDEYTSMQDPAGNTFAGRRSSLNVELSGRVTQQQILDICAAGRIGLPFDFEGRDMFVALKEEVIDDSIPAFTDEGEDSNIVSERGQSTLAWSQTSDRELINQWKVNFDDASNGYVDTALNFGDQRQQLRAGKAYGDRSVRVISKSQSAFGITNFPEAARCGLLLLYLGPLDSGGIANNFRVKFTAWHSHAFDVAMYGLIRVRNAKLQRVMHQYFSALGYAWYGGEPYEYFRVTRRQRRGDFKVEIEAQVYPQDFMERTESVAAPPPVVVGGGVPNPGGGPLDRPRPVTYEDVEYTRERVSFRLAMLEA
jgi:hypothetical protein